MATAGRVDRRPRPRPRPWHLFTLLASVLLALALGSLHFIVRHRLDEATRLIRQHGRAAQDLSTGFLHFQLGQMREGPWQRERGLALLTQSLGEFNTSAGLIAQGTELSRSFEHDLREFQHLLAAEEAGDSIALEVELRLALSRLESSAEAVDAQLRSDQIRLGEQMDTLYCWSLVLAMLLIGGLTWATTNSLRSRRRLFTQLAEQEERFRSVVEQSVAGICIVRDGRVTYANARLAELMGMTAQQLVGHSLLEFIVPPDHARGQEAIKDLLAGTQRSYTGTFRAKRADGVEIEFDVQANPITIDGAPAVVAVLQDASDRQRLQREKLEALQLLESIAQNSPDAIFAKDLEGRYTLFNAEAERLAGNSVQLTLGKTDRDVFPPIEAGHMLASDEKVVSERKPIHYELDIAAAGTVRTIDCIKGPLFSADGRVTGIYGISRDITRRKEQELALEESRAQLSAVIDALDEGLIVVDPQGVLLSRNPAARRITNAGTAEEELHNLSDFAGLVVYEELDGRVVDPQDWPSRRVLRGEPVNNLELLMRRRDKVWSRILSFNGTAVRASDGSIRFVLLTFSDITQRKQVEAALQRTQRMESLGTLAAGIAHDFNNLLLAISGNAAMARSEVGEGHPARESLTEVLRAGQRASDLVKRILLFARAEDSTRGEADLRPVIEEALKLLKPTLPAGIRLRTLYDENVGSVAMDTSQIHQVVVNLLTNAAHAIEAKPGGAGEIVLQVKRKELAADASVNGQLMQGGPYLVLSVTDDGCGMEPRVLDRIFDPFFTTKPVGKGTGLGLPMVHGIVRDHGGAIDVSSQAHRGTRVDVYLPIAAGEARATADALASPTAGAGRHVLYVDDEEALVFLITRYLRKLGYRVTGFSDPTKGVAEFLAHPGKYDVLVTDLSMPRLSGFDVARAVRSADATIPIILMSGFVRPEDHDTAAAVGVTEVLLKPSTVEDLGSAIDRQLR